MHVEIWTKPDCSYCTEAKMFLQNRNIPFNELRLDVHFTREQLLQKFSSAKSYPVIVVDGYYIGGTQDLTKYITENYQTNDKLLLEGNDDHG